MKTFGAFIIVAFLWVVGIGPVFRALDAADAALRASYAAYERETRTPKAHHAADPE